MPPKPSHSRRRPNRKPRATVAPPSLYVEGPERLQKVLASAGIGSRRQCEDLITAGRVEVDGKVVSELGAKVNPHTQTVALDGTKLKIARKVYYLVNKPVGIVSTNADPDGRPRIIDLLPDTKERLFTVGRLDMSSEGLILLTNDGELANALTHPRYGVEKTYQVLVAGVPTPETLDQLRRGVHLAEAFAQVDQVRIKSESKKSAILEMVLTEGRNREIRRIMAKLGHKVMRLKRVAIGPLKLKDLEPGEWRRLTSDEVQALRENRRGRPLPPTPKRHSKKRPAATGDKPAPAAADRKPIRLKPTPAKHARSKSSGKPAGNHDSKGPRRPAFKKGRRR